MRLPDGVVRTVEDLPAERIKELTLSQAWCPSCLPSRSVVARVLWFNDRHVLFCRGGRFSDNGYAVDRVNDLVRSVSGTLPLVESDALGDKAIPWGAACYDLDAEAEEWPTAGELPHFGGCNKCHRELSIIAVLSAPWMLTADPMNAGSGH